MPEELESLMKTRAPTAERPLLGLTVLVVEDSRFASEAMRLLCLRSGARIRRADSLRSAHRHLAVYRPTVVIIDLGLPDGSGRDLIADLALAVPRIPVILGMSGDTALECDAMNAGADGFLEKPFESLSAFQSAVLSHLPPEMRPKGPRPVCIDEVEPDRIALMDDLAHIAEILGSASTSDRASIGYAAQFLTGLAKISRDMSLQEVADQLAEKHRSGAPTGSQIARVAGVLHQRLQDQNVI